MEIKELEGYDFKYIVSKNGKIFKYKDGKISELKNYNNGIGYQMVSLKIKGKYKLHYVHRLVANSFINNDLNLSEINHIDFDKSNNCASNLEWCSRGYNMKHYYYTKFGQKNTKIKHTKDNKTRKAKNVCYIDLPYCLDFYKYTQKWRLRYKINGLRKHIGYFKTYNDAINKISLLSL